MFQHDIIYDLIAFQLVLLLIALTNSWLLWRARQHAPLSRYPRVSILVPARNEEANIERCVTSLLSQDYPDFEVVALDDESTDRTRILLDSLGGTDPRLRVLDGRPLEPGWLGKNWACAQLAAWADGELLFFTDADTYHQQDTLRALVTALEGERADLLAGFPRQVVATTGEKLIVPFFSWVTYCITPLALGYRWRWPAISTAVGQALLFRREAYEGIGGHGAVRAAIVEDLELARRIKAGGYRWRMARMADLIACRMYRNGRQAAAGLSRNLFAAFNFRVVPFVFAWAWLLFMFLKPWIDLGLLAVGQPTGAPIATVLAGIGLALAVWMVPYRQLQLPLWPAALYPLTMMIMGAVALRSLWYGLNGRITWKERAIIRPRIRLF